MCRLGWSRSPTPDGTSLRDYIHVGDLARGHVLSFGGLPGFRTEKGLAEMCANSWPGFLANNLDFYHNSDYRPDAILNKPQAST
jgi:hypothetical protein